LILPVRDRPAPTFGSLGADLKEPKS
jgi:hypothetical protein